LTGNNFLVFTNHTYKGRWKHVLVFELVAGLSLHRRGLYFLNISEMNSLMFMWPCSVLNFL